MMTKAEKWQFINDLDDELLVGGVTMSEWAALIVREVDLAFVAGAHLATIITAIAGIETHLRAEYGNGRRAQLHDLIEASPLAAELKDAIHQTRKYRNQWVHISDPSDDQDVLDQPDKYDWELEDMARKAMRLVRRTIYQNQWI